MASATITLTDAPDGGVDVVVTFGPAGMDMASRAHDIGAALNIVAMAMQAKLEEMNRHG